jgi:hypothetical protein
VLKGSAVNHATTTPTIPSRPTAAQAQPSASLWKVTSTVQRTGYAHTWGGYAPDAAEATRRALAAARNDWPGFSLAVTAVVQVA